MVMPAVSLKLKKIRRKFGGVAPRVVVRSYQTWHLVLAVFLLLPLLYLAYSQRAVGDRQQAVVLQLMEQSQELKMLRMQAEASDSALSIERAAQRQLLTKVRELELENVLLKEDLLTLERLLPGSRRAEVLRIEAFSLTDEGLGSFRYRVLFSFLPGKTKQPFKGHYKLVLHYRLEGRDLQRVLPDNGAGVAVWKLELKHLARREGRFDLPQASHLVSAEIQIFDGAELKARFLKSM